MFRTALRTARSARALPKAQQAGKRFASTAASRSGTWKGAAARWAAAGAVVYYYNTSNVFAEEPQYAAQAPLESTSESETYRTVDSIAEQRRAQARSSLRSSKEPSETAEVSAPDNEQVAAGSPGALEEEAEQQGAFNEETGEINWDCPCLGGMAHGPCGDQFKAAFSCFVFSKEEPKGVDCIEHFKTMQNCFRDHPEIYGSEMDEEEVDAQLAADGQQEGQLASQATPEGRANESDVNQRAETVSSQVQTQSAHETDELVPKSWHDSRESNSAK